MNNIFFLFFFLVIVTNSNYLKNELNKEKHYREK